MTGRKLDTLPTEVILMVAKHTITHQCNDLLNLKLTNKTLNAAAKEVTAHTIRISTKNGQKLEVKAKRLLAQLTKDDNLKHVRKLVLKGHKDFICVANGWLTKYKYYTDLDQMPEIDLDIMTQTELDALVVESPDDLSDEDAVENYDDMPKHSCPAGAIGNRSKGWTALAELISKLPRLEQVSCACVHQLPLRVLKAINQPRTPTCKLDICSFSLSYSYCQMSAHVKPRGYELALLSSPTLHKVGMIQNRYFWAGNSNRPNNALTAQLLLAYSPSIKSMTIVHSHEGYLAMAYRGKGLLQTGQLPSQPGTLQYLRVHSHDEDWSSDCGSIDMMSHVTSWQSLRTLELPHTLAKTDLDGLTSVELPALRKLQMHVHEQDLTIHSTLDACKLIIDQVRSWLSERLSGLTHLELNGMLNHQLISDVLLTHGNTLQRLHLRRTRCQNRVYYSLRPDEVYQLVELCPEVVDLRLPVARQQGDAGEVAIYETIGRLKKLQHLTLDLDIFSHAREIAELQSGMPVIHHSAFTQLNSSNWEWLQFTDISEHGDTRNTLAIYNVDVCVILRNAIVDEQLAVDIYQCLLRHRNSSHERLQLQSVQINIDTDALKDVLRSPLLQRYISIVTRDWRIATDSWDNTTMRMTSGRWKPPHGHLADGVKQMPAHRLIFEKIWTLNFDTVEVVRRLKATQTQPIAQAWGELPSARLQMMPDDHADLNASV